MNASVSNRARHARFAYATASAALLSVILSRETHAQSQELSSPAAGTPSCLARIPAESMTRVAVFVSPAVRDSTLRAALPSAANLTQAIADRARALLGAGADTLPEGEPTITWRELQADVVVTGYRDGRVLWRVERDSGGVERPGGAAARLLARALGNAQAAGEAPFFWPEGLPGDSVVFRLELVRPGVDGSGTVRPIQSRVAIPVFSVAAPREEPVVILRPPRVHYPGAPRSASVVGTVILQFIVDTTGRADVSTLRDVWPADRPRLTGELAGYYREFISAVRRALVDARYTPARIGGCPVRQLVRQPFSFKMEQ